MGETDMALSGLGLIRVARASLSHPSAAPSMPWVQTGYLFGAQVTGLTLLQKQRKYGLG